MKRGILFLIVCGVLLVTMSQAKGQRQTLHSTALKGLATHSQLVVRGNNSGTKSTIIVVRVDDSRNPSYADRVNLERVVPPGPYRLTLPLGGMKKSNHQPLDLQNLHQIIVFAGEKDASVSIDALTIEQSTALAAGVLGWDLGPKDSAVWPGFMPLDTHFSGLKGKQLSAIDRSARQPAHDGLTSDGIRGIESLHLPVPAGRWRITLWLKDRGEWEYLPHPLQREITANGTRIFSESFSPSQWITQRYLAGLGQEYQLGDEAWQLYGQQPREQVSFDIMLSTPGLTLAFSGHLPEAGFLAAVLADPVAPFQARAQVETSLARWWTENWPVQPLAPPAITTSRLIAAPSSILLARGTSGALEIQLDLPAGVSINQLTLSPLQHDAHQLHTTLRWGRWQLRRTRLSSTLLHPVDHHLRASVPIPISNGLPRRLHIQVDVPERAPTGHYRTTLSLMADDHPLQAELSVMVPDVDLPALDRPVGVYLERPVQLTWFDALVPEQLPALECDARYLRQIGLSGLSPGLTTPSSDAAAHRLIEELAVIQRHGFFAPLAYAPIKRLQNALGPEQSAWAIQALETTLRDQGLRAPLWSIADEPSNPGEGQNLSVIARYMTTLSPDTKLAGHLNNPTDTRFLKLLDVALINAGFGVNEQQLERVRSAGAKPWLYNMEDPRKAAGFFLWASRAEGYLQWHARMPTASPFDPTDGREDDVQYLYPSADTCPAAPDIDRRLFALVEGINDLRWMRWLEQRAQHNAEAQQHLQQLTAQIPRDWQTMLAIPDATLTRWRDEITALASRPATQP